MARSTHSLSLSSLARLGFTELATAADSLHELSQLTGIAGEELRDGTNQAASADAALHGLLRLARADVSAARDVLTPPDSRRAIWRLFGSSRGLADFFVRHPGLWQHAVHVPAHLPTRRELGQRLRAAVGAQNGFAATGDEETWVSLRIAYRCVLSEIAAWDLASEDPAERIPDVAAALADAAAAALEAALAVARTRAADQFGKEQVSATRLAIIGMGKAGARELNYLSDVDVIFVGGTRDPEHLSEHRAVDVGTRLARDTMQVLSALALEPALWEVDAALRPEGKQGPLVRTLASHVAYYDRWAQSWEFQALLKAQHLAGDKELAQEYLSAVRPRVWGSAAREDFVQSVQRMRERVTENIVSDELPYQIKLGPGGLRDIEFTVQLLQLVHGLTDDSLHVRSTLDALHALEIGGYIGRADAAVFARHYRSLRLLEHRVQLWDLRRTHLMPRTPEGMRFLARATGLAETGTGLWEKWEQIRREVRDIHVRLFYRPLLSAVAALPEEGRSLSEQEAQGRLAAIGFRDPAGALRHIGALTAGLSRTATIQRHLMPVMVGWFAEGIDPDAGLLTYRRIAERLGSTPWFLRMLRDSSGAARRLTRVLSASRFAGDLMEWIPESVAWLDDSEALKSRGRDALEDEVRAILTRHGDVSSAARAIRSLRRRELLRTALGSLLDVLSVENVARALTDIMAVAIAGTLAAVERVIVPEPDRALRFAVVAMGRFGGGELGFGSDADVLFIYDPQGVEAQRAQSLSLQLAQGLREHLTDARVPLDLDADLRPEGRTGALVRSLDAYAAYYERWSLSWEAQALLRAQGTAGAPQLIADFLTVADGVRYPATLKDEDLREIKRIKARIEGERLPQGVDPRRHLKLGPGGLSDVEWLTQLVQLQHAHRIPELRTTSTLVALSVAADSGLIPQESAEQLREAWLLATQLRSAIMLRTGKTTDVLPGDREELNGIARVLGMPDHSASALEELYLRVSRRARRQFERLFYG